MSDRTLVGVVAGAALIILLFAILSSGWMGMGMMGPFGPGGFAQSPWWWGILMGLFWILVLGAIIFLVVWIVRSGTPSPAGPTAPGSRAEDILRERYARGEITREQYEEMRRDIER